MPKMETEDVSDRIPITEWPMCSPPSSDNSAASTFANLNKSDTAVSCTNKLSQSQNFIPRNRCTYLHVESTSQPSLKRRQESSSEALTSKHFRVCDEETEEHKEPLASVRVAKWWRSKRHLVTDLKLDISSKNPNTRLYHISRTEECQDFLREERNRLRKKLLCCSVTEKATIFAALASIEDWLDLPELALQNITKAVDQCAANAEHLWLKEKISKQCKAIQIQNEMLKKCNINLNGSPQMEKVERVSSKNLSVQDFKEQFMKKGKPVILEHVVSSMVQESWDLEYIKCKAGSLHAPVKRSVPGSIEWAKLEEDRAVTVAEHIDNIKQGISTDYLFDWSLPLHSPQLAAEITVPKYFSDNFLTQTSPGSLYHDSWPSLFVAPAGITSDLHVDAFASSFWMALFYGEKRWTFYDPDDLPLLYPKYLQSLDPVFSVNVVEPDTDLFPLLALTKPKQCVLKPGDLLFVPAGSPHFVENLTASVAVSSNYVDGTNHAQVCEALRINGLLDPQARQLLQQLESFEFKPRAMPENVEPKIKKR